MNAAEAAALLGVAASFDNRKPDADAAHAWAAALEDVSVVDGRAAIVEHYRHEHRWVMPSDVLKGARKIAAARHAVTADVPAELQEMDDGPEFNAAYLEWQKSGQLPQKQLSA